MSDNRIEKLTFITLYDRSLSAASLTRQLEGGLPGIAKETSDLFARFQASYCAENMVLLVTRTAYNSAYWELNWLPEKSIQTISGLDVSGAVETIYAESRAWQERIEKLAWQHAPELIFNAVTGDAILEKVADQINAGALGPNVTASVSPRKNKKAR